MKKSIAFLLVVILVSIGGYSQTADEVINKHIEAMGGAEKLKSLKSLYMEGVAVMQNGNEIISKIYKVHDKLL